MLRVDGPLFTTFRRCSCFLWTADWVFESGFSESRRHLRGRWCSQVFLYRRDFNQSGLPFFSFEHSTRLQFSLSSCKLAIGACLCACLYMTFETPTQSSICIDKGAGLPLGSKPLHHDASAVRKGADPGQQTSTHAPRLTAAFRPAPTRGTDSRF